MINRKNLKENYKILNPVSILIYVWILVYLCHSYYWSFSENITMTYTLTTIGIISLSAGFWLTNSNRKKLKTTCRYNPTFLRKAMTCLLTFEILRLLYYSYVVVFLIAGGTIGMLLSDGTLLRNSYLNYDASFVEKLFSFSTNLVAYIGHVLLAVFMFEKERNRWLFFIVITILELAISIVTMSKLSFSLYLVTICIAYINKANSIREQRIIIKRIVPSILITLFGFFLFIGFQRNYMETKDGLSNGVIDGIINYFGGPLQALNILLGKGFAYINRFEHGMVNIGRTETNVYTWYSYYYQVASYIGFLVFPFLFGVLAKKMYKPWKQNLFYDVTITWICVIFAFSFFDLLLKFTVFQFLFVVVWIIDRKFYKRIYT